MYKSAYVYEVLFYIFIQIRPMNVDIYMCINMYMYSMWTCIGLCICLFMCIDSTHLCNV